MAVLGIEGTAHTIGVGIVEPEAGRPGRCRILANERAMLRPAQGGIHPREAAHHHVEAGPALLRAALEKAGLRPEDLEGVAFSQGPGLGPCLRVAATMARALAARTGKPLAGVNHCVAHLEIGRGLTEAQEPMLLYASGANTQVLALARGRYRVFGETLDIGIGNALDKFARDNGIPFPGGPEIERLALEADPAELHPLPYTVKGMDLPFAGLVTAAQRLVADGVPLPAVCHSLQETAFAALVEVAERALAHTRRDELVLGGGVACNARLQQMARAMCEDRGLAYHCPPRGVLVDNGAMIAWLGHHKLQAGDTLPIADSAVLPHQRTDQVDVTWRPPEAAPQEAAEPPAARLAGAEAILEPGHHLDRPVLVKRRIAKGYRHARLDERLRSARTRDEAVLLAAARKAGVPVPVVHDVDRRGAALALERVGGRLLRDQLPRDGEAAAARRLRRLGELAARLHAAGVTHGDLTASNVLVPDEAGDGLVLIDFGLGALGGDLESRGVDLHLVEEALEATDARAARLSGAFLDGYRGAAPDAAAVLGRLEEIRERGRYR